MKAYYEDELKRSKRIRMSAAKPTASLTNLTEADDFSSGEELELVLELPKQ